MYFSFRFQFDSSRDKNDYFWKMTHSNDSHLFVNIFFYIAIAVILVLFPLPWLSPPGAFTYLGLRHTRSIVHFHYWLPNYVYSSGRVVFFTCVTFVTQFLPLSLLSLFLLIPLPLFLLSPTAAFRRSFGGQFHAVPAVYSFLQQNTYEQRWSDGPLRPLHHLIHFV